ncbi:hypothetical protein Z043_121607 [Scleropages formosus]|uniref:Uncharacterized protein n=1 Tax=Scleropages formosus TaxID=113540 RepID=A0A0N8JWA6_SCLFO|nr:hypothetical protein Z043_121607 [Scleropages formosus]
MFLPPSLGYKPFLNLIRPQLQKLLEPASPRLEDSRGPASPGTTLPAEAPGGLTRPAEDHPLKEEEEKPLEEGTYDCTLS